MSIRNQVLNELRSVADQALAGVTDAIERERLKQAAEPCFYAEFHARMSRALPKAARIRRAYHKAAARRLQVKCNLCQQNIYSSGASCPTIPPT